MKPRRLSSAYFARVYAHDTDPWGFQTRKYEQRKYDLTVSSLTRDSYRHAFEPGCAIGVLSERLAARCKRLTSMELMPHIAAVARERLRDKPGARVIEGALPETWPRERFDLVVFSEVLYYLTSAGLDEVFARLDQSLAGAGHVLAVHYRGETDYPLTGDAVHARLAEHASRHYARRVTHEEDEFRLDLYERDGP